MTEEQVNACIYRSGALKPELTGVPARGVFCTRSIDLNSIRCIGYDMDYTLIDYKMTVWEARAYHYCKEHLRSKGFPVSGLQLDAELVGRGIIIDKEKGNLVKADRFGYVTRAYHGTFRLSDADIAREYKAETIDLRSKRWSFLNTLFSVSEGCLYAQLVDRLDNGVLHANSTHPFDFERCMTYIQLFGAVSKSLYRAHVAGQLKDEVMAEPERFVHLDAEAPRVLLDQRESGKKLALITNSDWVYTQQMMSRVYNRFLPEGMVWTDLFDLVVVSACKPEFFTSDRRPVYEIATADGMMREHFRFEDGGMFAGGNARLVEKAFGIQGAEVLYIGDHIYSDVNIAKKSFSWRTCLIMQELEREIEGLAAGDYDQCEMQRLQTLQQQHSAVLSHLTNELARRGGDRSYCGLPEQQEMIASMERDIAALTASVQACTSALKLLLSTQGSHVNQYWGYMSRSGISDKSHLMRQIEKYADLYTSRVANLLPYTPYAHHQAPSQNLAHDVAIPLCDTSSHWSLALAVGDEDSGA